jgi:hypothetical protein
MENKYVVVVLSLKKTRNIWSVYGRLHGERLGYALSLEWLAFTGNVHSIHRDGYNTLNSIVDMLYI